MIFLKVFTFLLAVTGIFILIYKNFNKIKAFIAAFKAKVMNVVIKIKNFFGERFLRRLPIYRASSEETEIAQPGNDNKKQAGSDGNRSN